LSRSFFATVGYIEIRLVIGRTQKKTFDFTFNGAAEQEKYSKSGYLYLCVMDESANANATVGTSRASVARFSCKSCT
jgi:hypothetical protein